ncbi:acyltransferase domain-containing protein [Paraburkholderia edwinii]|uniref:Acyltransferase domain-containing protein n=1 Tax=Paraburkholderia edwinii TaxID=2861782 RepID=A0ABX8V1G1_9BURK|nr:type I polyketide synthase [Paraburkholderia edwinii]QYD73422.1 acyltransferase domain-containing protein [Paraburkholderia edwinii]
MDKSNANAGRLAFIGMSFRFPGGGTSAAAYWAFLNSGRSAIGETPRERFDIDACYSPDPDTPGTTYSRVAGYVDDPFRFDRKFFRTSAAEAMETDPQQRWMLEMTWAALENAGLVPSELRGKRVGVFMTTGEADYGRRTFWSGDPSGITTYSKLGNLRAMAPGRVAHLFGFSGPALFVDTTCSSSLVAIHLAAQSLRTGDCDIAIAGGVNLILGPEETIGVARLQAMSASGHCRPFDADADGYIRGEGGGVVVIKRLEDALAHGDRIDAVLAGSAINSDGASNGLTAPNGAAQEAVIRHALARAGVSPEEVAYVEAHGTGTSLGDPIELSALRNVYSTPVARQKPMLVGSVKAQVGHLEGAAGMAGIIKAMLILRHRYVPAQVNFSTPNPRFRWDGAQLDIPRYGMPLDGDKPIVGISGFGITGTNVHLILAAHENEAGAVTQVDRERVLTLSGRSPQARERLASAYRELLANTPVPLRDVCYTASVRREHFAHRVALVGTSREDFIAAIDDFLNASPSGKWHAGDTPKKPRLAFLFPGQGAWQPGVGAQLYNGNWIFRQFADACFSELDSNTARDVLDAILGQDPASVRHHPGQLAHFVVCYSLARTWMELGQQPDLLIGHSLGEHVAAVIGGVMTLADGLKAVEARGRLFDTETPRGAMLAVAASVEELSRQFEFGTDLFVAGMNGPEQTVVSGTQDAVAKVHEAMTAAGKRVSVLKTYDTPGHSPMLRSMRDGFRRALEPLTLTPARIPIVSTLTGQLAAAQVATVEHWLDLVEQPVRFLEALHLASDGKTTFIEVGPGAALSKLARAKASGDWQCAISSLADGPDGDEESETTGFAHACAHLYSAGHAVAWGKMYGTAPQPAELPTYRFDEERFELPFPQRKPSAPAHHVERLRQEIAEIGEVVANAPASVSADTARGDNATSDQLLATIRSIAASVASDSVSLVDDLPLVQLGMDSLALTELRVRLHQTFGKMPPMSMLARGASLISLAGYFASSPSRPATETRDARKADELPGEIDERALVVSLREGTGPVIALVHPIGGDVLSYQDLASVWPGDPTIVAVRHPYADHDREVGYLSIEQLAALYRAAFVTAVGRVPDLLGGWSFGGLVAQEMAVQWEAEHSNAPPLLIVDSPLYSGTFATRLANIVSECNRNDENPDKDARLVAALLADSRFDAMLDNDFGLSDARRRAHPAVFTHLARLHASCAAALARHRPRQVRARISYALATRGKGGASGEQVAAQLRLLTTGEITVKVFDDDHDSIVRMPSAEGLAHFLDGATAGEEQLLRVTEA